MPKAPNAAPQGQSGRAPVPASTTPHSPDTLKELWKRAIEKFEEDTKLKMIDMPFYSALTSESCKKVDDIVKVLEDYEVGFRTFREIGKSVREVLEPIVRIISLFLDTGAEAAASLNVPGGKAIFVAFGVFLKASDQVSNVYDGMERLLERLSGSLTRFRAFTESSLTPAMQDALVGVLAHLLDVLSIAIRYCQDQKELRKWWEKAVGNRAKDYLAVILGKTDVQDALQKLDELTNTEHLLSQAETHATAVKIHAATVRIEKNVNDVRITGHRTHKDVRRMERGVERVDDSVQRLGEIAERDAIDEWLNAPDVSKNRLEKTKQRAINTGIWFLDQVFEPWRKTDAKLLWLYGYAGSGKSVLFTSVLDALQKEEKALDEKANIVLYFFFDFRDPTKQDPERLLTALLNQLGDQCTQSFKVLQSRRQDRGNKELPSDEKLLRECLSEALTASRQTKKGDILILVDGLDECSGHMNADGSGLFSLLSELVDSKIDGLRLFVTSRPEHGIMAWVEELGQVASSFDLKAHHGHVDDISRYISSQLASRDFKDWDPTEKDEVRSRLIEKGNGMFLWIGLQLNLLKGTINRAERRAILEELPRDLDEAYTRILEKFCTSKAKTERVVSILQCIAFALRPLFVEEVDSLSQVNWNEPPAPYFTFDSTVNSDFSVSERESKVWSSLPGLFVFVDSYPGRRVVQFIHASAKQYFLRELDNRHPLPSDMYRFTRASAHVTLTRVCLSSIHLSTVTDTSHTIVWHEWCNYALDR